MKLIEKLGAEAAHKADLDPALDRADDSCFREGFEAGFRKAREEISKALHLADSYEWEEALILKVGEEEVE